MTQSAGKELERPKEAAAYLCGLIIQLYRYKGRRENEVLQVMSLKPGGMSYG